MIHHPLVLGAKLILLFVFLVVLLVLYHVLPPEQFHIAVWVAGITFVLAVVGLWVFAFKVLSNPNSKLGKWMFLPPPEQAEDGDAAPRDPSSSMVGNRGVAVSALRPAGTAMFGQQRVSVVTDGEFIEKNSAVEVVSAQGSRIVVRAAPAPSDRHEREPS